MIVLAILALMAEIKGRLSAVGSAEISYALLAWISWTNGIRRMAEQPLAFSLWYNLAG
jgi:hypothetical protein